MDSRFRGNDEISTFAQNDRSLPGPILVTELTQPHAPLTRVKPRAIRRSSGFWVTSREAFWIALETLRTHKLRSFLTLLGVVIATTTLIVVMSVINGMNLYIADHIANLGANVSSSPSSIGRRVTSSG